MDILSTLATSLVVLGIVFMAFLDALLYFLFKVRLAHSRRNIIAILVATSFLATLSLLIKTTTQNGGEEIVGRGWPVAFLLNGKISIFNLFAILLFYLLFVLDSFTIIKILRLKVYNKKLSKNARN